MYYRQQLPPLATLLMQNITMYYRKQ